MSTIRNFYASLNLLHKKNFPRVKPSFILLYIASTGKKHHPRRHHRAARPTSPYSTDSNFSAVVHKPYPKSQRKKQLMEQGQYSLHGV